MSKNENYDYLVVWMLLSGYRSNAMYDRVVLVCEIHRMANQQSWAGLPSETATTSTNHNLAERHLAMH